MVHTRTADRFGMHVHPRLCGGVGDRSPDIGNNSTIGDRLLLSVDNGINASWLQPYPLGGFDNGTVQYTAFPNFGTKSRSGSINIAGRTFTVTQAAATGAPMERFVRLFYFYFLGRTPSAAEVALQVASGLSREQLALNFFNSSEFNAGGRSAAGLYVGLLNRDAEFSGWLFQRDALSTGVVNQDSIVANFINSDEFAQRFGALDNRAFVTLLYKQVLLRYPTVTEVDFHAGTIAAGLSRAAVARNFLNSAEFVAGTGPRLTAFLAYSTLLQRQATTSEFAAASVIAAQAQSITNLDLRRSMIRDQLLSPIVKGSEIDKILE